MNTKQAIAIIGAAGKMGSAIAKSISKGNYRLVLHSSNKNKLECLVNVVKTLNADADVEIADDYVEACWEADIIIMAVPFIAEKGIAEIIRKVTNQKTVISLSNPINNTYSGLMTGPGTSAAEELQKDLPHAKLVKAFNTTPAVVFDQPTIAGQLVDCFIAGNDEDRLQVVYDLVKTAGFNPVIAGDLSASRTLESMQLLMIRLAMQHNYKGMAGWKILHN
jgi:predicted dinucleotide-binding enzyme